MTDDLKGRVALVTGGSRGIGKAIAIGLAAKGARVVVNHRAGNEDGAAVVAEIVANGGEAIAYRADVSVPDQVDAMVAHVKSQVGPVDILVNNAGIAKHLALEDLHLATWDATMAVNLRAPFVVTSAVLPDMRARKWGRLLFVSSTAARVGGVVGPHYAASKGGMEALMRAYAALLAKEGITSNAIAPALIETEMLGGNPNVKVDRIPVGRFGTSEEVANLLIAVASNPYITGQTFQVNGGLYMT